jgi:hypothetical protein
MVSLLIITGYSPFHSWYSTPIPNDLNMVRWLIAKLFGISYDVVGLWITTPVLHIFVGDIDDKQLYQKPYIYIDRVLSSLSDRDLSPRFPAPESILWCASLKMSLISGWLRSLRTNNIKQCIYICIIPIQITNNMTNYHPYEIDYPNEIHRLFEWLSHIIPIKITNFSS